MEMMYKESVMVDLVQVRVYVLTADPSNRAI